MIRRLSCFVEPNPTQSWLRDEVTAHELTAAAIKVLYELRTSARATGYVSGSPGRGKTMFLQQLLRSIDVEHLTMVPRLSRALRAWWTTVPVGAVSFNGRSSVGVDDHLLVWLDAGLPLLVRIIFTETWDPADPAVNFPLYRARVLTLLREKKLQVTDIKAMAVKVLGDRMPASPTGEMGGVLLVDEVARLSLSSLSDHEHKELAEGIQELRAAGFKSHKTTTAAVSEPEPAAAARTAVVASTAMKDSRKVAVTVTCDTWQPEDPAMATAEAVRKATCDWCEDMGIRPVMTAFNERFIKRQAGKLTGSLSTVKELVTIPLLPATELIDQQKRRLEELGFYLRTTSAAGQRRQQRSETTARHLERFTLGHPRAAVVLDNAIQASSHGDVFMTIVKTNLDPSCLSVAKASIDILAQYPVVLAAGLLNYDLPSSGFFAETLSYDTVFGEGALVKRPRARPDSQDAARTANPAIIVTFFLSAIALQHELEVKASFKADAAGTDPAETSVELSSKRHPGSSPAHPNKDSWAKSSGSAKDIVKAVVHDVSGPDGGVYSACREVRSALLVGSVPVAWENLFLWSEVLMSRNRALLVQNEALLRAVRPLPFGTYCLRKLYPAPDRLTGTARWLGAAQVDASCPRRGVVHFSSVQALVREYCDDDLVGHVWRPWRANFEGIDGIMFLRCTRGTRGGPRKGELVAVAVDFKSACLKPTEDMRVSCSALCKLFGSDLWKDWQRRTALVLVVREKAPVKLDVRTSMRDLEVDFDSAIVVDADSLEKAYGTTISTFAVCADSLFGAQVVRRSRSSGKQRGRGTRV